MKPPAFLDIEGFNPVQELALKTKFLENQANIVVSSPTGSGKTVIALLAAMRALQNKKKTVYTCPLRALASEQHKEFSRLPAKVGLSTGDLDSSDTWLEAYDIIVTSFEKLDSLIRHHARFLKDIGLLIIDEIHMIDSGRGPTIETIIMRLKQLFPKIQIVALSATIPNAKEIAGWLEAELVESNWRPTKLSKGVFFDNTAFTTANDFTVATKHKDQTLNLCDHVISSNNEAIVFCNTRRSSQALARRLIAITKPDPKLESLSSQVLNSLESPTSQCRLLADCVKHGIAFHHAGLVAKQRRLLEDAFRERKLSIITATPTLALGVNLPAESVVLSSIKRYTVDGLTDIPVREYLQMSGRAGRPTFSKEGVSLIITKSEKEKERCYEKFVLGQPELIQSQLGWEPVLRMHILASIASEFTRSRPGLHEFLLNSFHAFQFGESAGLMSKADSIVEELVGMGFVMLDGTEIRATRLGKRVSELYINPVSAYRMISFLGKHDPTDLGLLFMIVNTEEIRPWLRAKRAEEDDLWLQANAVSWGVDINIMAFDDYLFLDKFKTVLLMRDWINEKPDNEILKDYNVAPGILRSKLANMDWISYSICELAKIQKLNQHIPSLICLRRRLKQGIRAELLELTELKHIGRVRARRLFSVGFTTLAHLKKAPFPALASVLGKGIAQKVQHQLSF